ncbi:hypothetical protein JW848_11290 [Candidatus Bipolaricaulota bacterium]|nr:hypothetical protein [Candidatus Bipolaricaulota bacterium]
MKRGKVWMLAAVLALISVVFVAAVPATAQTEFGEIVRFEVSDLQLISWNGKADWGPSWTGPIEAATIVAWFHEHGFPRLLTDLNGDGVVDELDTTELADGFGRIPMRTEQRGFTTDARLVYALASYVAERYPDQFVLKLYDTGFPIEFAQDIGVPFAADAVPGIEMIIEPEPNVASYRFELQSAEGVILGIAQSEEINEFFAGRSFLLDPIDEQLYGIDMVWAKEDVWTTGTQGQVLATEARQTGAFYVLIEGSWRLVEFMLALSPVVEPGEGDPGQQESPCPEDAVAYDVTTTDTPYGRVEIEECVTREDNVDTYTYTVHNISFLFNDCGICWFAIPNFLGLPTIDQTGPACWFINPYTWPVGWDWKAPLGNCGILPGEAAVFEFSVPGPTIDIFLNGGVMGCPTAIYPVSATDGVLEVATESDGIRELRRPVAVRTTGPGEGPGPCPDLVAEVLRVVCDPMLDQYAVVITARVVNIGLVPAGPSDAAIAATYGGVVEPVPALGPGDDYVFTTTVYIPAGIGPVCPLAVNVRADSGGVIVECDEDNNVGLGEVCCEDVPTQEEGCPDPYIRSLSACYYQTGVTGAVSYAVEVSLSVRNRGDATAEDVDVELNVDGNLHTAHFGDIAPAMTTSKTITVNIGTSVSFPIPVIAAVDPDNDIDESCYPSPEGEFNNVDADTVGRNDYCYAVN